MAALDPWERSLRILERGDRGYSVAEHALGTDWSPHACGDPHRKALRPFETTADAVRFVVARIRRIARGRREPRVRFRLERLRSRPGAVACVLVVGGSVGRRPIYVKWFIDSGSGAVDRVIFLSFHESDRPWH